MRYNVAQLLKGPTGACRHYELDDEAGCLDQDLEVICPLVGSITLMRTSQGILVTGRVKATVRVSCLRCLEPCDVDLEFDLEDEFHPIAPVGEAPVDEVPEEEDDEALLIDEHNILDLGEVLRQNLWLDLPAKALCRPDCAGLCPHCGNNRNRGECRCDDHPIDARWAALRALVPDESDS